MCCQIDTGNELRSWDGEKTICKYSLFKECVKKLFFLEIVSVMKIKNKLLICIL